MPSPWQTIDIGTVGLAGSASESGGVWTLDGAGADIWDANDGFRFVYRTLSGNGSISARVTAIENTHAWAKAGVMIRDALIATSSHICSSLTPSNGVQHVTRDSTGYGTSYGAGGSAVGAPYWVKVTRSGGNFYSYESADGSSWTQIGDAIISMATDVYVGLFVCSHDTAALNTATFDGVALS